MKGKKLKEDLSENRQGRMTQKTVLTIAGSDSSGGAGIQADLKTIEAHGLYGMSVITALTAQNTMGITGIMPINPEFVAKQLDAVCSDIIPDAVKIGMLPDSGVMRAVAYAIDKYELKNVVLDPVLSSTSGTHFSGKEALEYMKEELFPRSMIITPNIPEAEILRRDKGISSREDMVEAAKYLAERYGCNVLLKGGHSKFDNDVAADLLYYVLDYDHIGPEMFKATEPASSDNTETMYDSIRKVKVISDGFAQNDFRFNEIRLESKRYSWLIGKRFNNPNTHGTGCTFSSAIACELAKGLDLEMAVNEAKLYIGKCIEAGMDIGHGRGPLLHVVVSGME